MKIIGVILTVIGSIGLLGLFVYFLWKIWPWLALGFIFYVLLVIGLSLGDEDFEIKIGNWED